MGSDADAVRLISMHRVRTRGSRVGAATAYRLRDPAGMGVLRAWRGHATVAQIQCEMNSVGEAIKLLRNQAMNFVRTQWYCDGLVLPFSHHTAAGILSQE
jgi:hypothetical protein